MRGHHPTLTSSPEAPKENVFKLVRALGLGTERTNCPLLVLVSGCGRKGDQEGHDHQHPHRRDMAVEEATRRLSAHGQLGTGGFFFVALN